MDYRVIKENDLFLLTDFSGDIAENNTQGLGLYTRDTRFLSRMELRLNGDKPIVLSSEAGQNYYAQTILTNRHMEEGGMLNLWRESIELERSRFIYKDVLYESIRATNFNPHDESIRLSVHFDADYHDMFIVRGYAGATGGKKHEIVAHESGYIFGYTGADQVHRQTKVNWSKTASKVEDEGVVHFDITLSAREAYTLDFVIKPVIDGIEPKSFDKEYALEQLRASYADWENGSTAIKSDMPLFDKLYEQGLKDIRVLMTNLGFGDFPVAGVPWFAVPFGRDSLIAALQLLPVHPEVARGTLFTMAQYQGAEINAWRDEEPGKIMHELRGGELANTNEIPFTPYYGTIDATPLFLVLLGEYVQWTDDRELLMMLLPHIDRALQWIDQYGDIDGDGFVEYDQKSSKGLSNQGWKDSGNSIVHRNGEFAKAPIALVEVQGYVYQAKTTIAKLFHAVHALDSRLKPWAIKLEEEAEHLRKRFEHNFWLEDEQYYAIALDHGHRQVRSVTSNPGHVLMSGMMSPERAEAVADKLLSPELFSGYGIRTMATSESGYNPMSYHNGSIWPHDNSLCLIGLSKLGYHEHACRLLDGLLKSATYFEDCRLPELFCGYAESRGRPVPYPVACAPQAWAAGTAFVMLEAMLGIRLDASRRIVRIRPTLPSDMNELHVRRLKVGQGQLELVVRRLQDRYAVDVIDNTTGWQTWIESHHQHLKPEVQR